MVSEFGAGLVAPAGGAALAQQALQLIALDTERKAQMGKAGNSIWSAEIGRDMLVDAIESWIKENASRQQRHDRGSTERPHSMSTGRGSIAFAIVRLGGLIQDGADQALTTCHLTSRV